MNRLKMDIDEFLESGFNLKLHLATYLNLSYEELDVYLQNSLKDLSLLHPGNFKQDEITAFYESKVGTRHLFELANWHLQSSNYIADTLRLQKMFAHGMVLDFGGGIGTHAISAALLPKVEHVFFVDLNPHNREFVQQRVNELGIEESISIHRDLNDLEGVKFNTITCLDVLEHLPDPALQLLDFVKRLSSDSIALMNWYFFKGYNGEYPFHIDDRALVDKFFLTLQTNFIEVFHPLLITARAYKPLK